MEGSLYKKGKYIPSWNERYFVLRHTKIAYFLKPGDTQLRGVIRLSRASRVSPVELRPRKTHRALYSFVITFGANPTTGGDKRDPQTLQSITLGCEAEELAGQWREKIANAIKLASLLPPTTVKIGDKRKPKSEGADIGVAPVPMTDTLREASLFKNDWAVASVEHGVRILVEKIHARTIVPTRTNYMVVMTGIICLGGLLHTFYFGRHMLSIASMILFPAVCIMVSFQASSISIPCLKVGATVRAPPEEVWNLIMDLKKRSMWDGSVSSARLVQVLDDHTDIIHVIYKPVKLGPLISAPRDLCLMRYWRKEEDGSYIICHQSTEHPECGPRPGVIRGHSVGGGFTIAPRTAQDPRSDPESLVTEVVHLDPGGWIRTLIIRFRLVIPYFKLVLVSVLGIRDAFEQVKFVSVYLSDAPVPSDESSGINQPAQSREAGQAASVTGSEQAQKQKSQRERRKSLNLEAVQSTLPRLMWDEPEVRFKVRGKRYLVDKKKVITERPAFRLVGVDLFETTEPTEHIASYEESYVQKIAKHHGRAQNKISTTVNPAEDNGQVNGEGSGDTPFTFIVSIIVPGPPCYNCAFYFCPEDPSILTDHSAFAELMSDFLDGDDMFRDERFKLIPSVVEGNFIVRQSVGNTPAIIGNKLRQPYFRGKNYFELDIDVSSNSVARSVVGLASGYAKKLVVDMGFVLEGRTSDELPERLFGAVRIKHMDFSKAVKLTGKPLPMTQG